MTVVMSAFFAIEAVEVTSLPSKNSLTEFTTVAVLKSSIVSRTFASLGTALAAAVAVLASGEAAVTFGGMPVTGTRTNQS